MRLVKVYEEYAESLDLPSQEDTKAVMKAHFMERWSFVMSHYCCGPCQIGCPCQSDKHDSSTSTRNIDSARNTSTQPAPATAPATATVSMKTSKFYLDPSTSKGKAVTVQIRTLVDTISRRVDEYVHGHNTCFNESLHRQRMVWALKEIDYWRSWKGRCHLTVCWNHLGHSAIPQICEEMEFKLSERQLAQISKIATRDMKDRVRWAKPETKKRKHTRRQERSLGREDERGVSRAFNERYNEKHVFDNESRKSMNVKKSTGVKMKTGTGAMWRCELCNKTMRAKSKYGHLKSKKHTNTTKQASGSGESEKQASGSGESEKAASGPGDSEKQASGSG
jgi:hypothetical protein